MNPEYKEYYLYLEELRKSGIVNMFGANRYLQYKFNLSEKDAIHILYNWMANYEEINAAYY